MIEIMKESAGNALACIIRELSDGAANPVT
jgi:hypothetical protein